MLALLLLLLLLSVGSGAAGAAMGAGIKCWMVLEWENAPPLTASGENCSGAVCPPGATEVPWHMAVDEAAFTRSENDGTIKLALLTLLGVVVVAVVLLVLLVLFRFVLLSIFDNIDFI